jgi:hypothetical protein
MQSQAFVATSFLLAALSGCIAASDGEFQQEFDTNVCSGASPTVTAAMLGSGGYDGIVVIAVQDPNVPGAGSAPVPVKAGASRPELCTRATNRSACEAKVADGAITGWPITIHSGCCGKTTKHAVVATRGDDVFVANTDGELATMLGPIDQKEKALLFALARGWNIDCATPSLKRESATWVVRATFAHGCGGVAGYALAVKDNGAVMLREQVTLTTSANCM